VWRVFSGAARWVLLEMFHSKLKGFKLLHMVTGRSVIDIIVDIVIACSCVIAVLFYVVI
jgi:hypothetical protein